MYWKVNEEFYEDDSVGFTVSHIKLLPWSIPQVVNEDFPVRSLVNSAFHLRSINNARAKTKGFLISSVEIF